MYFSTFLFCLNLPTLKKKKMRSFRQGQNTGKIKAETGEKMNRSLFLLLAIKDAEKFRNGPQEWRQQHTLRGGEDLRLIMWSGWM